MKRAASDRKLLRDFRELCSNEAGLRRDLEQTREDLALARTQIDELLARMGTTMAANEDLVERLENAKKIAAASAASAQSSLGGMRLADKQLADARAELEATREVMLSCFDLAVKVAYLFRPEGHPAATAASQARSKP